MIQIKLFKDESYEEVERQVNEFLSTLNSTQITVTYTPTTARSECCVQYLVTGPKG